ncbi:hypothetical protein OBBRIDRAFT_496361 [Obba rivulosa]|uniref:Uncharacterized protein n=1 Tax=Obba rivulosa TaxID=1052685 RepID=A0A8E2J6G4_9APHY|nr:hypothetical protein OBBRIDRAFT_496361 [Obba rivulosa]
MACLAACFSCQGSHGASETKVIQGSGAGWVRWKSGGIPSGQWKRAMHPGWGEALLQQVCRRPLHQIPQTIRTVRRPDESSRRIFVSRCSFRTLRLLLCAYPPRIPAALYPAAITDCNVRKRCTFALLRSRDADTSECCTYRNDKSTDSRSDRADAYPALCLTAHHDGRV